ncbi:hypothetical protein DOTSEDRAFT_20147 [Lecanosticta acicola]|uniref:NADH:ubiquinone oxidoreductase intermediate-associated protein 30 domain-containing protein n=1 Tax=Lecanosticta acicola TaxID=111012 RepID=A0AAI8Z006_9PEZI|nr:hypothetical protein DOTSEDRAFT_20147 [Lecanosticta acicola]
MAGTADQNPYTLFGGDKGWSSKDWTASDDRVRGGKSESHLECTTNDIGRFWGNLDIETLGGAGFASQRTTGDDRAWDLSGYAGVQICIEKGDKRRYTFNLKDELLPPDPDTGREQSTVSYECDFELPPQAQPGDTYDRSVFIPWASFNATYRGKPKKDAGPINLKKIKRVSIMMRSFFGAQEGDFSLSMRSINALSKTPSLSMYSIIPAGQNDQSTLEKGQIDPINSAPSDGLDGYRASFWRSSASVHSKSTYLALGTITLIALYLTAGRFMRPCPPEKLL